MKKETGTDLKWRELALQFDGHRMQAICFLKQILSTLPETEFVEAREFLKSPPLPGGEVLRRRVEEIAKNSIRIRSQKTLGEKPTMDPMCRRVKDFIRRNPKCTYAQIAEGANVPMSMVSACLRVLVHDGHVAKTLGQKSLLNSYEVI